MRDKQASLPLIEKFYGRFLKTEQSAEFIRSVACHYTMASLEKLADAGSRVTRRGAVLAIGFLGDIASNPVLGRRLLDQDRAVRMLADHGIRQLWMRVGNLHAESTLRRIGRCNQRQQYADAIDLAGDLLVEAPGVAEAWNQRAIAWYSLEDFDNAIDDCKQALICNPWHFLAALGMANCHLELGNIVDAIHDFRLALGINPDLEMVRSQVRRLEKILEGS
jgi:tetratricopeptide (TPR) repeat protein